MKTTKLGPKTFVRYLNPEAIKNAIINTAFKVLPVKERAMTDPGDLRCEVGYNIHLLCGQLTAIDCYVTFPNLMQGKSITNHKSKSRSASKRPVKRQSKRRITSASKK